MSRTDVSGQPDATTRPAPARTFTDEFGRTIAVHAEEGAPSDARDRLAAMYGRFEPTDRTQGLPPADPGSVRTWLDDLDDALHVLARHEDRVVGHGILAPSGTQEAELAAFVERDYQRAGIGTRIVRSLVDRARDRGHDRVWVQVERRNEPAIHVYEKAGFEPEPSRLSTLWVRLARDL